MKIIIASLVLFFLMASFTQAQVKFRVKIMNADSLSALIPEKEGPEKIDVLNLLSNVICRNNIDSSILLANQAIELSKKIEYQKGLADGYFNVGNGYFLLDSLQSTISNYLKALRIYEDLVPSVEFGNLCLQLSVVNYYTGKFNDNVNYGREALHLYESLDDKVGQAMLNHAMGSINLTIEKDYDSAAYYYEKALTFLDPILNQTEASYIYKEMGGVYKNKFYESSDMSYFYKSVYWYTKGAELPAIADEVKAWNYLGLGDLYLFTDADSTITKGKEYLNKVVKLADSCFDAYDFKTHVYVALGRKSYYRGNYDKAIFYFEKAINITEERTDIAVNDYKDPILGYNWKYYNKVIKKNSYYGLYYIYYQRGNYKKALEYNNLYKQAEEEIYKGKNQKMITMLESISEDEKIEKQMAVLAKDNELKELAVKQSRTYLFALSGFVVIIVLAAILFFRQRRTRVIIREQQLLHDLELKNMESEKLKELDHLKSRFFANISHEFRTPLTLIMGPLEKVLSKTEDNSDKKELNIAKKYAGRLQILINNLLSISKLESGKMELLVSKTNVVKLVRAYIQSFESLAKQKNIALDFKTEEKEIIAYIDREKFEQVLNNLLSNAFKFTGEGGEIKIAVSLWPLATHLPDGQVSENDKKLNTNSQKPQVSDSPCVEIKITDTGRGIPPEHIDHIFDRFYQVGQENNSYYEGTGIGLALTKELVELHHGKIKVESEQGKGSAFTILLPLGKEHLNEGEIVDQNEISKFEPQSSNNHFLEFTNQQAVSSNQKLGTSNQQPILLIVEDNTDMRSYIREYFENKFQIIEAVNGEEGYEKSILHIPDIIISDVMMPKMDGNEFCKKVKMDERTSHIPVILLTAKAAMKDRLEGLETGADDFLTKPFDQQELLIRINNLLLQRKKLQERFIRNAKKMGLSEILNLPHCELNSTDHKFLLNVMEIINKNLHNENFNTETLQQELLMSNAQLYRKLKSLVGMPASGFIRSIRLNRAAELLKIKKGNITEIAFEVGFNNLSYFSKSFQEQFGVLPSEFNP